MNVQTNQLQLGGDGHDSPSPPLYFEDDIIELRDVHGATDGRLSNSIDLVETPGLQIVALFGLSSVGAEIGFAALPCPPYCRGNSSTLVRFSLPPDENLQQLLDFQSDSSRKRVSFFEALSIISSGRITKKAKKVPRPKGKKSKST